MDQQLIGYLHGCLRDWSAWLRDGQSVPGLYPTSRWPEGKPKPKARRKGHKQFLPPAQPHETKAERTSHPLLHRLDVTSEQVHRIVTTLDTPTKEIVCCLYLRKMCFADAGQVLNLTTRQLGKARYKLLEKLAEQLR